MSLDLPLEKETNCGYFGNLPEIRRQMFALFYASMLKMRLLTFDKTRLPSEKFFDILRFHCDELNLVGAVPLELAKYLFCPISNIRQPALREFCSKIRGIIVKERPMSSHDIYKDCLNATWDIFYYQSSCLEYVVQGRKQDLWILTGDQGLACLADAIYYDAHYDQELGAVSYHHIPDRDKYTYFRQCDRLLESKMKQRHQAGVPFRREKVTSNSFEAIARCEQQLIEMLDKL